MTLDEQSGVEFTRTTIIAWAIVVMSRLTNIASSMAEGLSHTLLMYLRAMVGAVAASRSARLGTLPKGSTVGVRRSFPSLAE